MNANQNWALFARSEYEYGELVRLIADYGWPCSDALKEQDGFQPGFSHVIWNAEKQMLWLARYPEATQITLNDMPEYMEGVLPAECNLARVQNIDADGRLQELMPVAPEPMRCEKKGCTNEGGQDYKRKKLLGGWAVEPIFLCAQHGEGRTPSTPTSPFTS